MSELSNFGWYAVSHVEDHWPGMEEWEAEGLRSGSQFWMAAADWLGELLAAEFHVPSYLLEPLREWRSPGASVQDAKASLLATAVLKTHPESEELMQVTFGRGARA